MPYNFRRLLWGCLFMVAFTGGEFVTVIMIMLAKDPTTLKCALAYGSWLPWLALALWNFRNIRDNKKDHEKTATFVKATFAACRSRLGPQ